jgi:hypothetical protein
VLQGTIFLIVVLFRFYSPVEEHLGELGLAVDGFMDLGVNPV